MMRGEHTCSYSDSRKVIELKAALIDSVFNYSIRKGIRSNNWQSRAMIFLINIHENKLFRLPSSSSSVYLFHADTKALFNIHDF